jgi:hypothetical protein
MKSGKPTGLSFGFSGISLEFSGFCFFFQKNQKLNFLNCNRPVFDEQKKPI